MAVSIKELIDKKEKIEERKKRLFDIETSAGTITVKQPTRFLALDIADMEDGDSYVIVQCTVEPNFKDKALQDAYGCLEPTDLPHRIFDAGEVNAIARKIMECAGYRKDVTATVHETVKN